MFKIDTLGLRGSVLSADASLMCAVTVESVSELLRSRRSPRFTKPCEGID